MDLFNAGAFWEAHEAWETIWLADRSDERLFLQGLIQIAAAYHHVARGTTRGAIRLFEAGLAKLGRFPPGFRGIDRAQVVALAAEHHATLIREERIDAREYPKLRYN